MLEKNEENAGGTFSVETNIVAMEKLMHFFFLK